MAAAIIPLVAAAVSVIGPQIPSIVAMVERLFGHSDLTKSKDGNVKMQAAVSIGTMLLEQLANAGKIPSAPVVDPSLPAGLAGAIQQAVDAMNRGGQLKAPGEDAPAANGGTWVIAGTLTPVK